MAGSTGLEPAASGVTGQCCNQTQLRPHTGNWWAIQGSNLWPTACKAAALPAELIARLDKEKYWKRFEKASFFRKRQSYLIPEVASVSVHGWGWWRIQRLRYWSNSRRCYWWRNWNHSGKLRFSAALKNPLSRTRYVIILEIKVFCCTVLIDK